MADASVVVSGGVDPAVTLVGELNPYGANPRAALFYLPRRASGNRLRVILGLSDREYLRLGRVNLCSGVWSRVGAGEAAQVVLGGTRPGRVLVLLGVRVAEAFRVDANPFRAHTSGGVVLATLPHPSGLCRVWNDQRAVERARDLLRRVAPSVPWGSWVEERT